MTVPNGGRDRGEGGGTTRQTQTKILRKILLTTLCTSVDQTVTQDHLLPVSTTVRHDMWTTIFSKDFDSGLSCKTSSKWNTNGQSLSGAGCSGGGPF